MASSPDTGRSGGIRGLEIDNDWTDADEDEDDLAGLIVDLAMDEPGGYVEEAAAVDADVLRPQGRPFQSLRRC